MQKTRATSRWARVFYGTARSRREPSVRAGASAPTHHFVAVVVGMHIIIGMPPHIIIIGAPMAIIDVMASQRSVMRDIIAGSVGIIFMTMPSFVISQDILHIIGVMPFIIIGIIMPMPGIMFMPFIIGIIPMPPIIMPFIGIMPIWPMPFIGIIPIGAIPLIIGIGMPPWFPPIMPLIIGFIGIIGIWFIAFMVSSIDSSAGRAAKSRRSVERAAS